MRNYRGPLGYEHLLLYSIDSLIWNFLHENREAFGTTATTTATTTAADATAAVTTTTGDWSIHSNDRKLGRNTYHEYSRSGSVCDFRDLVSHYRSLMSFSFTLFSPGSHHSRILTESSQWHKLDFAYRTIPLRLQPQAKVSKATAASSSISASASCFLVNVISLRTFGSPNSFPQTLL